MRYSFLRGPLAFTLGLTLAAYAVASRAQIGPPGGGGTPGGSANQAQYNNAGVFAGIANGAQGTVLTVPNSGAPSFKPSGMINVRTMYGGVPDGSTDNATAITNAFTAANAYSGSGTATVYFDCDTGTTTCEYNYSGAGTSPINPTVAMTIQCAPGVWLNYTGSAHAADIGATGQTGNPSSEARRYAIRGCIWTGGGSNTAGIYFNNFVTTVSIVSNEFISFGQGSTFSIVLSGNNWDYSITDNVWHDLDGTVRGVLDAHLATNANIHFINNKIDCGTAAFAACSIPSAGNGVGLWITTGYVAYNQILAHYPAIRLGSCSGGSCGGGVGNYIDHNQLEGNSGGTSPAITYGDPGGTAAHVKAWHIDFNNFFWPTTGNINFIGPETPAAGNYQLDGLEFIGNYFSDLPNSTTPIVNANGNSSAAAYFADNTASSGPITQSSTTPLIDTGTSANHSTFAVGGETDSGTSVASHVAVADTTGTKLSAAGFHDMSGPRLCLDSTGSGTAQTCNTTPKFTTGGVAVTPVAGDEILYKTTTTNTGDLTIAVNGGTALHVKKFGGNVVLQAGDIVATVYYVLTLDSTATFWEMQVPYPKRAGYTVSTLPSTAATGQVTGAEAYVTDAVACTFLSTLTGGGSAWCPVGYNGSAWVGE